jgi:uncharacterized protein YndB with AHSA1/START domain
MHPIIKTVGGLSAALPSDREIRITRSFNAPREMVWDAHTKPELLKRWLLGPPGWQMPVCDIDLRVGGKYRYEWHWDGKMAMALSGTYRAVDAPAHLADTQMFDDNWTQGPADTDITLVETDGKTFITMDIKYASQEARDLALSTPMMEGMEAGYERLERLN